MVRDDAAYPDVRRYEYHSHVLFGRDHYYDRLVKNADGEYDRVKTLQGTFADFCTVDVDSSQLGGLLAPCHKGMMWVNRDTGRWEKKNRRERIRHVRRSSRDSLRVAATEYDAGEDLDHDGAPYTPPQRELY
jgi:hypothetical protein